MRTSMRMAPAPAPVWLVSVCVVLAAWSAAGRLQAQVTAEAGLTLLESHLPAKTPVERADCRQLAIAVHASVLDKPKAAYVVVSMALSVPGKQAPRWLHRVPREFACGCVTRITRAAVTAWPARGADILEAAVMLFPDCAENLTAMLSRTAMLYASLHPGNGTSGTATGGMSPPMMGTDDDDGDDGFGNGTATGFPGAPGFAGSVQSGGGGLAGGANMTINLPGATVPPVTPDSNG